MPNELQIPTVQSEAVTPRMSCLPKSMAAAFEPKIAVGFDDEPASAGARVRELPFKPPDIIPAEWCDRGREFIRDFEQKDTPARAVPGGTAVIRQWLVDLIGGTAHGMTVEGLMMRAKLLSDVVEKHPMWCFTRDSRIRGAERFQYVPTTKELAEFVAEIDAEMRQPARKVMAILDAGPRRAQRTDDAEPYHQRSDWVWSKAEADAQAERLRERKDRERRQDAAKVAADAGQPPVPQRAPGESDALFMARLQQHRNAVLDSATADFKRGKFAGLRPLGQTAAVRASDNPVLKARADAMGARARNEADELAERIEGAAK